MGAVSGGWEYVIAVYLLTIVVIAGLVIWVVLDYRIQRATLSRFEAEGVRRRSSGSGEPFSGEPFSGDHL